MHENACDVMPLFFSARVRLNKKAMVARTTTAIKFGKDKQRVQSRVETTVN